MNEIHTDATDAARMADEHARVYADAEREYQAEWRATNNRIDEMEQEIRELRERHSIAILRHLDRTITANMRATMSSNIAQLRTLRATL